MELECVFFSVTPTFNNRSRITLLLTSSSLAKSLIRTFCCIPPCFLRNVPCAYAFIASSRTDIAIRDWAGLPPLAGCKASRTPEPIVARRAIPRPARSHLELRAARGYEPPPHLRAEHSLRHPRPQPRNTVLRQPTPALTRKKLLLPNRGPGHRLIPLRQQALRPQAIRCLPLKPAVLLRRLKAAVLLKPALLRPQVLRELPRSP